MTTSIEDTVLQAVDTLIKNRVSHLQFDKTVRASILQVIDSGLGHYQVQYQNSVLNAYSEDSNTKYRTGDNVFIRLPSNPDTVVTIISKIAKKGTQYLDVLTPSDRMTQIGSNILVGTAAINFCSYSGVQTIDLLQHGLSVDKQNITLNKGGRTYIGLKATVQTALPLEQQVTGNYGIILQARYYDSQYAHQSADPDKLITRTYVLDVNNMIGQPYKFTLPTEQVVYFQIDGNNLYDISAITAFCKDFPNTKYHKPDDIFLSNFGLFFAEPLNNDELSTASLKILTPNGNYIISDNDDTRYLEAELKIKGKKINLSTEKVEFYWFIKDTSITAENTKYYNSYGGAGWRCLNESRSGTWMAAAAKYQIKPTLVPSKQHIFKCVAIYDNIQLNAEINFYHASYYVGAKLLITSTAGAQFYFNTGHTKLTAIVSGTPYLDFVYYWGYRTKDGTLINLDSHNNIIDVRIHEVLDIVTYECTAYSSDGHYVGTGYITLTNGQTQNVTVVIKNGSKVFNYDEYGKAPKITPIALSFDVITPQGKSLITNDMTNNQIVQTFAPKWIWPEDNYTMLTTDIALSKQIITNPSNNSNIERTILADSATFTYGIRNIYDTDRTDNTIRLEVTFGGKIYSANTNFIFIKQGQSGSNGTKYIANIQPAINNIDNIFFSNGRLYGYKKLTEAHYNSTSGETTYSDNFSFKQINDSYPLKLLFYDDGAAPLYDGVSAGIKVTTDQLNDSSKEINWSVMTLPTGEVVKNVSPNITVAANGAISYKSNNYSASVTQVELATTYGGANERKRYYATYPIDIATTGDETILAIVDGGYRECMYESDGTRTSFNGKPFRFRLFKDGVEQFVNPTEVIWEPYWAGVLSTNSVKRKDENHPEFVTIEPPSQYDSKSINNYVVVKYRDYTIIITIYLYLNRYGMAYINGWDGTSIVTNTNGDNYILAPQVGAGKKDNNNRFTGIVIGTSMYSEPGAAAHEQTGMFGYGKGVQTFFLDANTGSASFGAAGHGQINISTDASGGTNGTIASWSYFHGDGIQGMLIDFDRPQIKFKSGNFSVTPEGYLTAKGGGDIAGWKISDKKLTSQDGQTTLYSYKNDNGQGEYPTRIELIKDNNGSIIGWYSVKDGSDGLKYKRIDVNNKFIVYSDGSFTAGSGSNFFVDDQGNLVANNSYFTDGYFNGELWTAKGNIAGWVIDYNSIHSVSGNAVINSNGSLNFGPDNFVVSSIGNLTAKNAKFIDGDFSGKITATSGTIGGWTIYDTNQGRYLKSIQNNVILDGQNGYYKAGNNDVWIGTSGTSSLGNGKGFILLNYTDTQGGTDAAFHAASSGNVWARGVFRANSRYHSESSPGEFSIRIGKSLAGGQNDHYLIYLNNSRCYWDEDGNIKANDIKADTLTTKDNISIDIGDLVIKSELNNYLKQDNNDPYVKKSNLPSTTADLTAALTDYGNINFRGENAASVTYVQNNFERKGASGGKTSDQRLKTNIHQLSNDNIIQFYKQLQPVTFKYCEEYSKIDKDYNKIHFGLIAQDVQQDINKNLNIQNNQFKFISKNKAKDLDINFDVTKYLNNGENEYYTFDYSELHALHISMIQHQEQQIAQLKAEIEQLKKLIKNK